jgi:23S rRNA (adenine2503-C2)-methyltransferase
MIRVYDWLESRKEPKFRTKQFNQAFYKEQALSFESITTWPKNLRELAAREVLFDLLELVATQESKDSNTTKFVFKRENGQLIETVLMRHKGARNTVCVSCMRGCPVKCTFCATGALGFGGHLSADEIVEQVVFCNRLLAKEKESVSNVVFMGMGEPMLNLNNVEAAIEMMTNPEQVGLGGRKITLSTSGYVAQLRLLMTKGFRGRLAISLHAPNQLLREELMPVAKVFSLDELMQAMDDFVELTNKRITYEYVMISEVNDRSTHAHQLGKLLEKRLAHVNLIPYNKVEGKPFERSSQKSLHRFAAILASYDVAYSIRGTMGDDIAAACGQLAAKVTQAQA